MIFVVTCHLKALIDDLEGNDWYIPSAQKPFRDAFFIAAHEVETALNDYHINHNQVKLQQILIITFMDFNQRWDSWLSTIPHDGFKSPATKTFHEMVLRFSKGIMKAWRIWLIDIKKDI